MIAAEAFGIQVAGMQQELGSILRRWTHWGRCAAALSNTPLLHVMPRVCTGRGVWWVLRLANNAY